MVLNLKRVSLQVDWTVAAHIALYFGEVMNSVSNTKSFVSNTLIKSEYNHLYTYTLFIHADTVVDICLFQGGTTLDL